MTERDKRHKLILLKKQGGCTDVAKHPPEYLFTRLLLGNFFHEINLSWEVVAVAVEEHTT